MFLLSLAYQAKYLKAKRTLPQKAWWNTNWGRWWRFSTRGTTSKRVFKYFLCS
jgi:hypothetical protein